jgi:hypothetical protein
LAYAGYSQKTDTITGTISHISSNNVYVRFNSTEGIMVGDALYEKSEGIFEPVLTVENLSSISCVCTPLRSGELKENDKVFAVISIPEKEQKAKEVADKIQSITTDTVETAETTSKPDEDKKETKEKISGRVAVSSYSDLSNTAGGNSQRMRYTFSFDGENFGDSPVSLESYISFRHRSGEWNEVQDNIFNALKIYNLALKYDVNQKTRIYLGRKINPKISSLGAIDGVQAETKFSNTTVGAVFGSRPDYTDYSIDPSLMQFGAYTSHEFEGKNGKMTNSLGLVEQQNNGKTDRRFTYFQHFNTLMEKVYLFASAEMDLYENYNNNPQSTLNLTNLYLSLRYRPSRKVSLSGSYSARKNIMYFETYETLVDSILDVETRQGYRLRVNYRPARYLSVGAMAGYRSRPDDPDPSQNLYGYVSYTRIPGIEAAATLSATLLQTGYLDGKIYSLRLSRDLIKRKLYSGLQYRYVNYQFIYSNSDLQQHIAELSLTWKMPYQLSLSVYTEGVFEKDNQYSRVYLNLRKRF